MVNLGARTNIPVTLRKGIVECVSLVDPEFPTHPRVKNVTGQHLTVTCLRAAATTVVGKSLEC